MHAVNKSQEARLVHLLGALMFAADEAERLGLTETSVLVRESALQMRYEMHEQPELQKSAPKVSSCEAAA